MDGQIQFLALTGSQALGICTGLISRADEAATISDRLRLIDLGSAHHHRFAKIAGYLESDVEIEPLVQDFMIPLDGVQQRLASADLAETLLLVKLQLIAYQQVCQDVLPRLDSEIKNLLISGGIITRTIKFSSEMLTTMKMSDPSLSDRLSLLSRRFTGELVALVQRLAAEKPELAALVTGEEVGVASLSAIGELISQLTQSVAEGSV